MDKVLTINDWHNGPKLGLCTYEDTVCIYERVFSYEADDWTDEYYLTPIEPEMAERILTKWANYCKAVENNERDNHHYTAARNLIDNILSFTPMLHLWRKKAVFSGNFKRGFIPVDYCVEWS